LIYLLRAKSVFIVKFISKTEDLLSLSKYEVNFRAQSFKVHSLHLQQNVIILIYFQRTSILHIQLILTSSEPTRQYLPVSHIFMYKHKCTYFIKINKIMLRMFWRVLLISYSLMCVLGCRYFKFNLHESVPRIVNQ